MNECVFISLKQYQLYIRYKKNYLQSFVQAINFAHFDFSFSNLLNYLLCSSLSKCLLKTNLQLLIFANKNSKLLFVRLCISAQCSCLSNQRLIAKDLEIRTILLRPWTFICSFSCIKKQIKNDAGFN